jgi:hypothetical protein
MEQKSKHQFTENGVMGTRKEWGKTTKKNEGGLGGEHNKEKQLGGKSLKKRKKGRENPKT